MDRSPIIPRNFVTLRQLKELKEKREQEEKLKKEEEERQRKLNEEGDDDDDEEEEEESLGKIKEEEKSSRTRGIRREWVPRRRKSGNLDAQAAANGRPDLDDSKKKKTTTTTKKKNNQSSRKNMEKEMPLSPNLSEKNETIGSDADVEKRVSDPKLGGRGANPNRRGRGRRHQDGRRGGGGDGMTELPISHNGFGCPTNEKAEVIGSGSGPVTEIEKRVSDLKVGERNRNTTRRGRGFGHWGRRDGGSGGGMLWVEKKTTNS